MAPVRMGMVRPLTIQLSNAATGDVIDAIEKHLNNETDLTTLLHNTRSPHPLKKVLLSDPLHSSPSIYPLYQQETRKVEDESMGSNPQRGEPDTEPDSDSDNDDNAPRRSRKPRLNSQNSAGNVTEGLHLLLHSRRREMD